MNKIIRIEWSNTLALAFSIALLPSIWAAICPFFGITTGAVALICAAVYVANGNKIKDGFKICLGFLCGDIWAYCALKLMNLMKLNANLSLFITLFILGALCVIIGSLLSKWVYLPSWLSGWAIGLTVMAPIGIDKLGSLPFQIGIAMIIGVWYVGAGVDMFQKLLLKIFNKRYSQHFAQSHQQ